MKYKVTFYQTVVNFYESCVEAKSKEEAQQKVEDYAIDFHHSLEDANTLYGLESLEITRVNKTEYEKLLNRYKEIEQ